MNNLQNLAQTTIATAVSAPATPVTLQKQGDNTVGRAQAGGEERSSHSDTMGTDLHPEQTTNLSKVMTGHTGDAGGGAASGGKPPSSELRGEVSACERVRA